MQWVTKRAISQPCRELHAARRAEVRTLLDTITRSSSWDDLVRDGLGRQLAARTERAAGSSASSCAKPITAAPRR
jgi:hypothetical protein